MCNIQDIFPDVLRIEVVGRCNFRCVHCPTGTEPNNRKVLTIDQFNLILDQFNANKFIPRVVVLYHGGEPLLNKNLAYFIRTLKALGVNKTVITTNASMLTEKRSEELILAGLDEMKVSFDGESASENNLIRKQGDFDRDAGNLLTFCKLRKKLERQNPKVIVSNVQICNKKMLSVFNHSGSAVLQNPSYLTEYFREVHEGITFKSFPAMVWPGLEKFENLEIVDFPSKKPKYCGALDETYSILSNGDVVTCCYDLRGDIVYGNVFETNMFDIWSNSEYINVRKNFREKKYNSLCSKCFVVFPRYLIRS